MLLCVRPDGFTDSVRHKKLARLLVVRRRGSHRCVFSGHCVEWLRQLLARSLQLVKGVVEVSLGVLMRVFGVHGSEETSMVISLNF